MATGPTPALRSASRSSRADTLAAFGATYDASGTRARTAKPHLTFAAYKTKCRTDYKRLPGTPKQFDALVQWLLPIWRNPMGFTKDQLRSIEAPTIIADGDHDEIVELAHSKEMATLIPSARLVVFENTSHFARWQDPAGFTKVLVEFLTAP